MSTAFVVAMLASAIAYSCEMFAMHRLPTRTLGVLLSLEPALGALCGWALLDERFNGPQWAAIASIMAATVGSAATAGMSKAASQVKSPRLEAD